MTELCEVAERIWQFPIMLPNNPLKNLNCYVIKGREGERNLLIDTGFPQQVCLDALLAGADALGLCLEETDVFLTHLHADHTGNASALAGRGCRIIISETDKGMLEAGALYRWRQMQQRTIREGLPPEIATEILGREGERGVSFANFPAESVRDGRCLVYGGYELECLSMPGHTPGHMCLYIREEGILFTGDHILFDITPNICNWYNVEDSLGTYLQSLQRIQAYEVRLPLPAHRGAGHGDLRKRVDELLAHHARRLSEIEEIVAAQPGLNACSVAAKMRWKIRAASWEDFPAAQKWFAMGEAMAHLDHLYLTGRICRREEDNGVFYYPPL